MNTMEILTDTPNSNLLKELYIIKSTGKEPDPAPFRKYTVEDIYEFYKLNIRQTSSAKHFANFVFLVVDEECVRSHPNQCILCSDAPDFGEAEDEIILKQLRLPIEQAMQNIEMTESLHVCPSEVGHPSGMALSIMPPPSLAPTPELIRLSKKNAIRGINSVDEALDPSGKQQ